MHQQELNAAQLRAVTSDARRLRILAGAGTGKTRTIVHRAARLVREGTPPEQLLLLTFTHRAASEMRDRVQRLVGGSSIRAGTFHSVAQQQIRPYVAPLGWTPGFEIIAREAQIELISRAGVDPTRAESVLELYALSINCEQPVAQVAAARGLRYHHDVEQILETYQRRKLERDVMDFEDLLFAWRALLDSPQTEGQLKTFDHILVDEFQDTTAVQASIVECLAENANVCVVGDEAQAIYGFRGAERDNILRFEDGPQTTETIALRRNYRSTHPIIDAANRFIQGRATLVSVLGDGPPVQRSPIPSDEPHAIVELARRALRRGDAPKDIAVICRTQKSVERVRRAFDRQGVPTRQSRDRTLMEAPSVRQLAAHFAVVVDPGRRTAWQTLLGSVMTGPAELHHVEDAIQQGLAAGCDPLTTLKNLGPPAAEIRQRLGCYLGPALQGDVVAAVNALLPMVEPNHRDAIQLAAQRAPTIQSFLAELRLTPLQEEEAAITVSTIHGAKGLEWATVIVASDAFRGRSNAYDPDEARRLRYVAATRARQNLTCLGLDPTAPPTPPRFNAPSHTR